MIVVEWKIVTGLRKEKPKELHFIYPPFIKNQKTFSSKELSRAYQFIIKSPLVGILKF